MGGSLIEPGSTPVVRPLVTLEGKRISELTERDNPNGDELLVFADEGYNGSVRISSITAPVMREIADTRADAEWMVQSERNERVNTIAALRRQIASLAASPAGEVSLVEVNQRLDELEAEMSVKNKEIGTLDISNINYANRTVTRMLGDKAVVKVTRSQGSLRVCVGVLIQFSDSMLHQLNQFFITSEIPNGDGEFDGGHTDTDCFVYFRSYGYTSAATPSGQWTQWRKLFDAADMSAFSQRLTAVEQTAQMKADMVVLSQSDYAAISNPDPDKFYFIYADDDQD